MYESFVLYCMDIYFELIWVDFGKCWNVISLFVNRGVGLDFLIDVFQNLLIIYNLDVLFFCIVIIGFDEFD